MEKRVEMGVTSRKDIHLRGVVVYRYIIEVI